MTDALSVAQRALEKAIEAMTQIGSHERECARRYEEAAEAQKQNAEKLDLLLRASGVAEGRASVVRGLLSGLPNAFWTVVITLAGSGVTILFLRVLVPMHGG